jgi:transcriptional regulator with XRE-family HTH domain
MAREAYPKDVERGKRLRRLREDVEYADLASAARRAGVSEGGLRKWEKGGEIERKSIAALARAYEANPRWIMTGEEPMQRPGDDFLTRLQILEEAVKEQQSDGEAMRRAVGSLATLLLQSDLDPAAQQLLEREAALARQWSTNSPHSGAPENESENQ